MALPRIIVKAMSLLVLLLCTATGAAYARDAASVVAVFPVENLTGRLVPAEAVRQFLVDRLVSGGVRVLDNDALEAFLTRHRVRYVGGIDRPTAEWLREETGVEVVLIASFELSSDTFPPKVAFTIRLVSTHDAPVVVWADDVGMAGDDAPGFFELGIVSDYQILLSRALGRLADSALDYLDTGAPPRRPKVASKFRSRTSYRRLELEPGRTYSIAVLPFLNLSERRNAGEILALLFLRHLSSASVFTVIDSGATRRQLLEARIIMDGGISLADAEAVAALVDADFVMGGRVLRYDDYDGPGGTARVEFSTVIIDKRTRRVVWSSDSDNTGLDGVYFFERGTTRSAHAMATQMVRLTTEELAGEGH